jgi:hypothetical protein
VPDRRIDTYPNYLVRVVLESGYDGIANGMRRTDIHDRIRQIHHRGDDGISKDTLREVGICPFMQGILLWIVIASGSLALIHAGWIICKSTTGAQKRIHRFLQQS